MIELSHRCYRCGRSDGAEPLDADVNFFARAVIPSSGMSSSLPSRAASDEDRIVAFHRAATSCSRLACCTAPLTHVVMHCVSSFNTLSQSKRGCCIASIRRHSRAFRRSLLRIRSAEDHSPTVSDAGQERRLERRVCRFEFLELWANTPDVISQIGRDALETTDRYVCIDANATTRGARTADRTFVENSRKDVRLAIEQIRLGVASLRD